MSAEPESLRGRLLVASPALLDPNFRRAVVLITEHSEEGAMGVVLNRPTEVAVSEAVPHLAPLVGEGGRVHVGGPVQPEAVVALAELEDPARAAAIAFADVGYLRADVEPAELEGAVRRVRVYAGYAGWAPGQLESELEESAWIIETAEPEDVFTQDAEGLWAAVLRRKGGQYLLIATMPPNPELN